MDTQKQIDSANRKRQARFRRRYAIIRDALVRNGNKNVSAIAGDLKGLSRKTIKDRIGLDIPELDEV